MYRFRIPEIFLGCFLTVAVFATGMLVDGGKQAANPASAERKQEAVSNSHKTKSPDAELTGSTWLTKDAAGFFTFGLVLVGLGQAWLFFFQLRYMRIGMRDATIAAKASQLSAETAARTLRDYERPWVFVELDPRLHQDGTDAYALFSIVNHGRFPATLTECSIFLSYGEPQHGLPVTELLGFIGPGKSVTDQKYYAPGNLVYDTVVNLQTEKTYAAPDRDKGDFFFNITVRYEWISGGRDVFSYCWIYDHADGCWTKYSGGELQLQ